MKQAGVLDRQSGMTLLELLFSAAVIGIAAAGLSALVMLNNQTSIRLFNKVDGLNAARLVIQRIGADIREAQCVGSQFGILVANPNPPPDLVAIPVDYCPAPLDPVYGAGQAPAGGWPGSPWPNRPYILSNATLVVQVPVVFQNPLNDPRDMLYNAGAPPDSRNGFPARIDAGSGNPPAAVPFPNVDTLVYQVVPDVERKGEYMLQLAVFPGLPPPSPARQRPAINPPQTLLRGIVGPINTATGQPQTFQYLDKTDATGTPFDVVGNRAANIKGVLINFELKRLEAGEIAPSTVGVRSAVSLRNNVASTP